MTPIFALLVNLNGTVVSIAPTVDPATVAEVSIYNFGMNTEVHEGSYPLAIDEIQAEVTFEWNVDAIGSDRFIVTPPYGVICDPTDCSATVPEGAHGKIILKPYEGY